MPLINLTEDLGPTQLRPKSHFYTRDLTKQLLLARVKGRLVSPTVPLLNVGDALLFDYRILHRGLGNQSKTTIRPILVLTFSKAWYTDVLNFPKRSLNTEYERALQEDENGGSKKLVIEK